MAQRTLKERRLLKPVPIQNRNPDNVFAIPMGVKKGYMHLRQFVLEWIEENTTGDFYVGAQLVYFCDDADAMAWTLYDMDAKVKEHEPVS